MIILVAVFCSHLALGIQVTKIPSVGTPPPAFTRGSLAYHERSNMLVSFGGYNTETKEYIADLYSFNLTDFTWAVIIPESDYKPPGLLSSYAAIYLDILYVFFGQKYEGISCDIYKFDLRDYNWEIVALQGSNIPGRFSFSSTTFTYLDTPHVAIYGGLTNKGSDNELFM